MQRRVTAPRPRARGQTRTGSRLGVAARAAAIAVVLALPGTALALHPDKRVGDCTLETWRAHDGLPGGWVRAIAQTPDGYLWLGTQAGLARYGGGPLYHLRPGGTAFEAAATDVMALHVARDGTLWVIPGRGVPACVRPGEATFSRCLPDGAALPDGTRVADVREDGAGATWIAATEGLYRLAAGRLALVHPAAAWGGTPATALAHDAAGRLWVGAAAGLFVARPPVTGAPDAGGRAPALERVAQAADAAVTAIFAAPAGHLWVAAEERLLRVAADGTTTAFPGGPRRPTQVIEDRDGNVWIGSRAGLHRFRAGGGFEVFGRADGLPDEDVSAVFEDREGSLWVGTRGGGVAQLTDRTLDSRAGPPSVREQFVNTLAEDAAGVLWVGSALGLTRWHDGVERTYGAADGLPSDRVLSVHPAPDGVVWVGTDRGLARVRGDRIDIPVSLDGPITALYLDPSGTLWIGAGDRLARLGPGPSAGPERIALEDGLRDQPLGEIRGIQHDDQGVLWVSAGGRLLRLAGETLVRGRMQAGAAAATKPAKVRSLYRDADGTLWLCTHDGLQRRRGGAWRAFGEAEGLGRHEFFQIVGDDLGFLWASTGHGILRVARAALDDVDGGRRVRVDGASFDSSDQRRDVAATGTRQPAAWKGRDGRLWFATGRGVVRVDPRRLQLNDQAPPVRIEQAMVDGRPARHGVLNQFPPGSGALELHFAAITLLEPRKSQHRYRLEGFDPAWVEAGTRRSAYYTNLPPGRYRFRVQGSNADGVWNQTGDAIELALAPHFHQTFWFYALLGVGALALVLAFHRMRVARLHGAYAATFAERTRVARELHDSLLQGMAATVLRLKGLRKRFRPEDDDGPGSVTAEIKEIEAVVASNIEETRRFVWDLRDPPAELAPALEELVRRTASEGRVDARAVVSGDAAPLPQKVRRELLGIAGEALANALAHGRPRRIDVHLRYEGDRVTLSVKDDGRGFDPRHVAGADAGHFGLQGMRERAAGLGAIVIDSAPGRGTKIEVTINRKELCDA